MTTPSSVDTSQITSWTEKFIFLNITKFSNDISRVGHVSSSLTLVNFGWIEIPKYMILFVEVNTPDNLEFFL